MVRNQLVLNQMVYHPDSGSHKSFLTRKCSLIGVVKNKPRRLKGYNRFFFHKRLLLKWLISDFIPLGIRKVKNFEKSKMNSKHIFFYFRVTLNFREVPKTHFKTVCWGVIPWKIKIQKSNFQKCLAYDSKVMNLFLRNLFLSTFSILSKVIKHFRNFWLFVYFRQKVWKQPNRRQYFIQGFMGFVKN